jgi:hypothetical protein
MPSDLLSDLATLYQNNKDVAGPVAGSLAYPAGRLLLWAGHRLVSAGCAVTRWACTPRPAAPLEEAVAVLIENVGRMGITARRDNGDVNLGAVSTVVLPDGTVKVDGTVVPYTPAETKAIKAAAAARAAELKAAERDDLRERAALGN